MQNTLLANQVADMDITYCFLEIRPHLLVVTQPMLLSKKNVYDMFFKRSKYGGIVDEQRRNLTSRTVRNIFVLEMLMRCVVLDVNKTNHMKEDEEVAITTWNIA